MGTVNFVGRERELDYFSDFLTAGDKENGVFVVIGERGIGKTALMKEIYTRVRQSGDELIGFYRLFGKTATHTPFVEALADLLSTVEEEGKAEGKATFTHIGATIVEVFKRRKSGLTKSVLKDVAKNLKFDETVNFLEQIWDETKEIPVIELAEETLAQHKQEFIVFYLDLLGALALKTNKRIVVMIDQFELATLSSVDFFMSLVRGLPQCVYVVASFKKGEEPRHYEAIEPDLRYEGSRIVELNGLSEDEIGDWIRKERGIDLLKPELKKIRRASGGFPIILNAWISQSEELNPDELTGDLKRSLFTFYAKRMDGADAKAQVFARKLSVLLQPLTLEEYARLVNEAGFTREDGDNCIRKLIQAQIFSKDTDRWFVHELMQEYVRDENMGEELMRSYHENAARFFEERFNHAREAGEEMDFITGLGCAYHFHHAGLSKSSFDHNSTLAEFCYATGLLDIAEDCYVRAIEDARKLEMEEDVAIQRGNLASVYYTWGRRDAALATNQELWDYFREKGDRGNEAVALHQIGRILEDKGKYNEALEKYTASLKLKGELGNRAGIAATLHQIGNVHYRKGESTEALEKYKTSLEIEEELGDKAKIAATLHQIGNIHFSKGEYNEALEKYTASLKLKEELGDRAGIAKTLHQIGTIHFSKGEHNEALEKYTASLKLKEALGDRAGIATTLGQIGKVKLVQKNYRDAIGAFATAASLFKELESPYFELAITDLASVRGEIGEEKFGIILKKFQKEDE